MLTGLISYWIRLQIIGTSILQANSTSSQIIRERFLPNRVVLSVTDDEILHRKT